MNIATAPDERALAAAPGGNATAALVEALRDPACYPHPVAAVEVLETHISHVLLAGEFAYKVKKPVRLPFLDFSTLAARRRCCEEEVRLNRRTAPQVYLGVVPIGGTLAAPRVGAPGPVLEYAVKMQRFPQEALYSRMVRRGALQPAHVEQLADCLADFHRAAAPAPQPRPAAEGPAAEALANFDEMEALEPSADDRARLDGLRRWTQAEAEALAPRFAERAAQGFERECHVAQVQVDGQPLLFDCIEFSDRLRRIDVMSDVAFAAMDLARYGLRRHAARFVNRYVERTGDYAGLAVLRFYQVYRAMVRAKVAWIRACQVRAGTAGAQAAHGEFVAYLELARRLSQRVAPAVVLMHGLAASGKTTASELLVEALGAVRVRSDVERKRLHGLDALAPATAAPGAGIYGERDTRDTYERLAALTRQVLAAGYPVVVDATFLKRGDRDRFSALAAGLGAGFQIAACTAPAAVLRARVIERQRGRADASDAGVEVLEAQLQSVEALGGDEWVHAIQLDTSAGHAWRATVESLARRFRADGS